MTLHEGLYIKSTDALDDTIFADVTILIVEYNESGAIGFIIDRPFDRTLNELEEFRHSPPFPIYSGGPVDREHLFFVHRRPDIIEDGIPIGNGIYYAGDFKKAIAGINNKDLSANDLKIFIGYCGWDANELENEIEEGSWIISDTKPEEVFATAN